MTLPFTPSFVTPPCFSLSHPPYPFLFSRPLKSAVAYLHLLLASVKGTVANSMLSNVADQDTEWRLLILRKIIEGRRRRTLAMQQYMLHCLQQKHRLIIQLLLLIVPILSRENATRVYRSSISLSFLLLNLTLPSVTPSHSRPQRPRSFWSAPRIATSGQVQHRKSAIHGLPVTLRMFRFKSDKSDWLWSQSIVFTKPFKNGNVVGPGQRSRFLVLTKRSAASGDENDPILDS